MFNFHWICLLAIFLRFLFGENILSSSYKSLLKPYIIQKEMTCSMSLELQDQEIIMTSLWENKLRKVEVDAGTNPPQTKSLKAA
jgi:hypothetical protein